MLSPLRTQIQPLVGELRSHKPHDTVKKKKNCYIQVYCTPKKEHASLRDSFLKNQSVGLPGGPVVKNPFSNAGDADSISGLGSMVPHAIGQLSP